MDVTALPFNRLVGLETASPESGFLLSLPAAERYLNHLGTVHAAAQVALAEASSGEFLLRQFGAASGTVPVVRRLEARFRQPAHGRLSSRASAEKGALDKLMADVEERGRGRVRVSVEVV